MYTVQQEHREVLLCEESLKQLKKKVEDQKLNNQQRQKQSRKTGNNSKTIEVDKRFCYL